MNSYRYSVEQMCLYCISEQARQRLTKPKASLKATSRAVTNYAKRAYEPDIEQESRNDLDGLLIQTLVEAHARGLHPTMQTVQPQFRRLRL